MATPGQISLNSTGSMEGVCRTSVSVESGPRRYRIGLISDRTSDRYRGARPISAQPWSETVRSPLRFFPHARPVRKVQKTMAMPFGNRCGAHPGDKRT